MSTYTSFKCVQNWIEEGLVSRIISYITQVLTINFFVFAVMTENFNLIWIKTVSDHLMGSQNPDLEAVLFPQKINLRPKLDDVLGGRFELVNKIKQDWRFQLPLNQSRKFFDK